MAVLDSLGMFDHVAGFPEQVATAARDAHRVAGLPAGERIEAVVVIGVGASGAAGDVVAAVTAPLMPVPTVVVKSYECPAFVGPSTLVFAVSASGDTEETVQATTDAVEAGARLVVVSGGGQLSRLADSWGVPSFGLPDGLGPPRTALGALAVPPLLVLEQMGLFPRGRGVRVDAAVDQLRRRRDEAPAGAGAKSEAATVARRIGRTIPIVHGGGAVGAVAASRWKTQINENAKSPAWAGVQPELSHNEVAGWGQHGDVTRQVMTAVALRHDGEHPQVGRRFDLVGELLEEVVADVITVRAAGAGDLAQLLDLALFGDYVSLWMAVAAGVDPGPVPAVAGLRHQLEG